MEAGAVKKLLQCPGKSGWWPSLVCYLWRQGEVGERAGLTLHTAAAFLEIESGTRGLPPRAQEAATQKTNQKAERTKTRGYFPFQLPRQAETGRLEYGRWWWQDGNPGSSSFGKAFEAGFSPAPRTLLLPLPLLRLLPKWCELAKSLPTHSLSPDDCP